MSTSRECLAKADELDNIGYYSLSQVEREQYARKAQECRKAAILAARQDSDIQPAPDPD